MAETIEIQKQLGGQTGGGGSLLGGLFGGGGGGGEGPPAGAAAAPAPLGGFWRRTVAFFLDMFLLFLFAGFWFPLGLDFFLDAPLALLLLHVSILLAYFTVLNGPVGKGRTIGKHVMGLITRGVDGQSLSWGAALLRSALQLAPIIASAVERGLDDLTEPGSGEATMRLCALAFISMPAMALLVVNMALPAVRRDKRGIHELLSGSITFRLDQADKAGAYIRALPPAVRRRDGQVTLLLAVTLLMVFESMTLPRVWRGLEQARFTGEMWEVYGIEGLRVHSTSEGSIRSLWPMYENEVAATSDTLSAVAQSTQGAGEAPSTATTRTTSGSASQAMFADAATTATTRRLVGHAYLVEYYRFGRIDTEELLATIAETQLTTGVAEWVQDRWDRGEIPERLAPLAEAVESKGITCETIEVRFVEILSVPWFPPLVHAQLVHRERFPFRLP